MKSEASEAEAARLAWWLLFCDEGLVPRARTARVDETPEADGEAGVVGASALALASIVALLLARLDGVDRVSSGLCLCGSTQHQYPAHGVPVRT